MPSARTEVGYSTPLARKINPPIRVVCAQTIIMGGSNAAINLSFLSLRKANVCSNTSAAKPDVLTQRYCEKRS